MRLCRPKFLSCSKGHYITTEIKKRSTSIRHLSYRLHFKSYLKVSPRNEKKIKKIDNVPKGYDLIYSCHFENYLKYSYPILLFLGTSTPLYVLLEYYTNGNPLFKKPTKEVTKRKIIFINPDIEIWIYSGAMVFFAVFCMTFLFKTPLRIYKHNLEQKYIGMFISAVPLKIKAFNFQLATETRFKNPFLFFTRGCQYLLDNKKAILFEDYFRTPADFFDMVGED